MATDELFRLQLEAMGRFIRDQRKLAQLSLRELAARTNVSNPYLSQIERGLHEPSVRVLRAIASALGVSAETLLVQAGFIDGPEVDGNARQTLRLPEDVIAADDRLKPDQRKALLRVYRSYLASNS